MPNNFLLVVRFGVFALSCLLSLAVIGLCIHTGLLTIWYSTDIIGFYFFQRFGLAAAGLTLLMCIISGISGLITKNAWISWNVVEVPILIGISAVWLAEAIIMDEWIAFFKLNRYYDTFRCLKNNRYPSLQDAGCSEFPPISALSYTIFALLMAYSVLTIILCIVGKIRSLDRKVWLVQAYYAEYFGKEPVTVLQPQQYYAPNQFQLQQPGMPPMMYVANNGVMRPGEGPTGVPMMMHNGPPGLPYTSESPSPPPDQKV